VNIKKTAAALAVGALALALTACGPETDTPAASAPAGDSVKLMVFGSFSQPPFPLAQIREAAQAAVSYVNANGGAGGSQIELIECDDNGTPDGAAACGAKAVEEGVAGVVGSFTLFGDSIVPQLEAGGIPNILNTVVSELEATSEQSFSIMSSGTPLAAALPLLKDQGCTNVILTASDNPQSRGNLDAYGKPAADAAGISLDFIGYPANTTDYTTVAQQIADRTNCVIYGGGAADSAAIITALSQMNGDFVHMPLSTVAFPESVLADLGAATAGVQVPSTYNFPAVGGEAVDTAIAEMKKVNPNIAIDDPALNAYAGVLTFALAADLVEGDITAEAISAVLSDPANTFDTGLYAPTNFAESFGWFPAAPRVAGTVYQVYSAEDGRWTPVGEPMDVSTILKF
jgi:ABC-type branched-subunit amino acid transport system substrate-binding protein